MTHARNRPARRTFDMVLAIVLLNADASSQAQQSYEDVRREAKDFNAIVKAENSKSALCRGYLGKSVALTNFDALATRLSAADQKGEYETTAQYQTRHAAAPSTSSLVAMAAPLERAYVRYDADIGAFVVSAGVIQTAKFSGEAQADVGAQMAILAAKDLAGAGDRLKIGLGSTEKVTATGTVQNALGATIRVSDVDRLTRGLSLRGDKLFGFARDENSTVMMIEAAAARAPAVKVGLRAVLVVEPEAPYTRVGKIRSSGRSIRYTDFSSIIFARPRCALIIDAKSRVLASMDTREAEQGE